MTQDLTIPLPLGKLNIRVAAWIQHEEQLLVSTFPDGSISLPGGRMKFGETSMEALQREMQEEIGERLKNPRFFAVIENFFKLDQSFHELLFVFQGDVLIREAYQGQDFANQTIHWLPVTEISQLKPLVLQELVEKSNQTTIIHLINQE
ncbi:NUDIX hydrolase [Enterococcus sp. LJL98]